jgi:hypothetical protein
MPLSLGDFVHCVRLNREKATRGGPCVSPEEFAAALHITVGFVNEMEAALDEGVEERELMELRDVRAPRKRPPDEPPAPGETN